MLGIRTNPVPYDFVTLRYDFKNLLLSSYDSSYDFLLITQFVNTKKKSYITIQKLYTTIPP